MDSGRISTNGQEIYYEAHGEGEPLVFIMGIGLDSTIWQPYQIPEFSRDYKVIVFDNRDAGRSSKANSAYAIEDMADDLNGLLDGLGIERAHILGHSMGGMIAQEFALRHSARVDKLILSGTGAGAGRARFDPIMVWNFVKQNDNEGGTFAALQFVWFFSSRFLRNHEAVDQTLEMLGSNPNPVTPEAYDRQAQAYVQHDALDRIGAIEADTLVITGERDRLSPPWTAQEVAEGIPGAEFHVLEGPGSSHAVFLERPDDYNNVVRSFVQP